MRSRWDDLRQTYWPQVAHKKNDLHEMRVASIYGRFQNGGTPKSSSLVGISMKYTIQLLGYPHFRKPPYHIHPWNWSSPWSWSSYCLCRARTPWLHHGPSTFRSGSSVQSLSMWDWVRTIDPFKWDGWVWFRTENDQAFGSIVTHVWEP